MSTGKRLAKRSIVGTRVCAPGTDGIWYSGKIEFVKTAPDQKEPGRSPGGSFLPGLTTPARYTVLFDNAKEVARLGLAREFRETELIGRGFRTIADVKLKPGQKVFLTYNGRENTGEVIAHDDLKDEVKVRIAGATNGAAQEVSIRGMGSCHFPQQPTQPRWIWSFCSLARKVAKKGQLGSWSEA